MASGAVQHRDVGELSGRHVGETAYIVGRGRSLLDLTAADFGPGPIIALNHAILQIRKLGLPNPIYSMQQDGCLVEPIEPETVLLSRHLSFDCFSDYPSRYLFSIEAESSMSTPLAVRIALLMGAGELVMMGHDAHTRRDTQRVNGSGNLVDNAGSLPGYIQGAEQAIALAGKVPIRWQDQINVLVYTLGADTGGVLSGIAKAFQGVNGWRVRSFVTVPNYIEYPLDLKPSKGVLLAEWERADVVHLHHDFRSFEKSYKIAGKRLPAKPFVLEFHGTGFREFPEHHLVEMRYRGAVGVTSTLDLHLLSPNELEWLPPAVDVETLSNMRQPSTDTIRICHAPTNRQIKSTDLLIAAVDRLKSEGYPVELDLIEHRPWAECLERKAKADIYFDQIILGYGCNALEAWGMGIPVIAGAADETLDEMERRFGHLPFYHATEDTIYDALRELVESPELRARYGRIGFDYVRRWHDYPVVVEQLKGIYRRALGEQEDKAA